MPSLFDSGTSSNMVDQDLIDHVARHHIGYSW